MLRAADALPVPPAISARYAQTPVNTTPRVIALARKVTANAGRTVDKVHALINWLGANTKYSLNAPLAPHGVDVVDDFLFRSKLGWCEQIASSLVILARAAGIPARLTTGFVPSDRDALTGRFVVREKDAHAWAEIYFPGVGWQGFDPTASVPLAGDAGSGGSWLQAARRHAVELGILVALGMLAFVFAPRLMAADRRRRARQASWSSRTLHDLERVGRKAGRARAPAETPREYAHALADRLGDDRLDSVGDALDVEAFSAHGASDEARARAEAVLLSLRP
jgi:transglutaminase-like putative cysteine protease